MTLCLVSIRPAAHPFVPLSVSRSVLPSIPLSTTVSFLIDQMIVLTQIFVPYEQFDLVKLLIWYNHLGKDNHLLKIFQVKEQKSDH